MSGLGHLGIIIKDINKGTFNTNLRNCGKVWWQGSLYCYSMDETYKIKKKLQSILNYIHRDCRCLKVRTQRVRVREILPLRHKVQSWPPCFPNSCSRLGVARSDPSLRLGQWHIYNGFSSTLSFTLIFTKLFNRIYYRDLTVV